MLDEALKEEAAERDIIRFAAWEAKFPGCKGSLASGRAIHCAKKWTTQPGTLIARVLLPKIDAS